MNPDRLIGALSQPGLTRKWDWAGRRSRRVGRLSGSIAVNVPRPSRPSASYTVTGVIPSVPRFGGRLLRCRYRLWKAIPLVFAYFDLNRAWPTKRSKGAIKLHLLLDHDGCLPCYGIITDGKTHEIRVARTQQWPPGSILVMDRGYVDNYFGPLAVSRAFAPVLGHVVGEHLIAASFDCTQHLTRLSSN